MLIDIKQSLKKYESTFYLFLLSFFLWNPAGIKADGSIEITGVIQLKTASSITVNSILVTVNSVTKISGSMEMPILFDSLKVGNPVRLEAVSLQNGTLVASSIRVMTLMTALGMSGTITSLTANSFTLNGNEVFVDSNTVFYTQYHASLKFADLKAGDKISARVTRKSDGTYLALAVMLVTENSSQEIEVEGKIQALMSTSVKVLDKVFLIDSATVILKEGSGVIKFADLAVGDDVEIRGFMKPDSTYLALLIKVEMEEYSQKYLEFSGPITAVTSNSLTVSGVTCFTDSSTVVFSEEGAMLDFSSLKLGDRVEVKAQLQSSGIYTAVKIKLEDSESAEKFELEGVIEAVAADNITVGGYVIYINSQTKLYNQFRQSITFADLKVGGSVAIKAVLQNGLYVASTIKLKEGSKQEIHVTGAIENISANSITVKGTVFSIDQNTEFWNNDRFTATINDLKVGQIVNVKAVVQSTNQFYAVRIKIENFWRSAVIVEGPIDLLTLNSLTVSNKTFFVDSSTVVIGTGNTASSFLSLTLGLKVEVKGLLDAGGKLIAKLIKVHSENEFELYGKIESLMTNSLVVAGRTITTDSNTLIYNQFDEKVAFDSLKVDQLVEVRYTKVGLNTNLAVRIEIEREPGSVVINGVVTTSSSTGLHLSVPSFSINNKTVFVSSSFTQIQSSSIQSGQAVSVLANQGLNGNYYAVQVQLLSGSVTSVNNGAEVNLPTAYELKQNYPNPFNPATTISFTIPKTANVILKVYNLLGEEVATLANSQMTAGQHKITFDASRLTSGVYFYRLKTDDFVQVRKMLLLK